MPLAEVEHLAAKLALRRCVVDASGAQRGGTVDGEQLHGGQLMPWVEKTIPCARHGPSLQGGWRIIVKWLHFVEAGK
ncbi:hypothetical protein MesoLj131a_00390 [Mesorhizobium sp. 131-2-1]|nr:hypothetical protein MesoLj131a_00390 [Mesorhizobium sp. 131-2-1]